MIEKLVSFLPAIIVLSSIVVILLCLYRFIPARLLDKEKLKNLKYAVQWSKEHKLRIVLMTILVAGLYFPALEELIFRAPLIVIFDTLSGHAWIGILVSSVLFAVVHYSGKFAVTGFEAMKEMSIANREPEERVDRFESKRENFIKVIKWGRLISSFLIGILLGYLAIKYQSLYLCFGVHAAWNLVLRHILGILAGIVVAVFTLIFPFISAKIGDFRWFLRQRRRKNNY
jgi:membrane protease YdiL (CAAX protease family)